MISEAPVTVARMTGIAQFLKVVVNVSDLQSGLRFWSALTGLEPGYIDPLGNFAGLGSAGRRRSRLERDLAAIGARATDVGAFRCACRLVHQ